MGHKHKILYVEDEPYLGKIVKETLELKGFEVVLKEDGGKVMSAFNNFTPDICILDVMLPTIDGFTLGTYIRKQYPKMPILFLTAKTQTEDLVKGFASGGTDYVKKPFSIEELIVRINNQLQLRLINSKNEEVTQIEEFEIGNYLFIPGRFELVSSSGVVKLSNRDVQIIQMLCAHQNKIMDRKELLQVVWGDDSFFNSRTLDVYIRKIRDYFSEDKNIQIVTLKGRGYQFIVPLK